MNWLTKASSALGSMLFPARPTFLAGLLKRTRFDYRKEVGDGLDSSVVTAPIRWVQRALPEARLGVRKRKADGTADEQPQHPLLALIQNPNPYYGDLVLWAATILSWFLDGNAYWIIVRNGVRRPAELWFVPPWMIEPKAPDDGSEFLSHYEYKPGGRALPVRLEVADVVHFRDGMNPHDMRKGLSALGGVIREIFMDLESSNFVASLLRNMGVPGVVISPKGGAMPAPEDVEATKSWFQEAFGGDRRGGPLVMGAPTEVTSYGFNPQQMNMGEARDIAEERVCACIGIPAAVVGFGAGLQTAKVGATMEELFKTAWRNGVMPVARAFADELNRSLLPEFGNAGGLEVFWDTSDVTALQEDEDKRVERLAKSLTAGALTVYDYKTELGFQASDADRVYLRPISVIEVPEAVGHREEPPPAPEPKEKSAGQATAGAMARGQAYATLLLRQQSGLQASFERPLTALFDRLGKAASTEALSLLEPKAEKADDLLIAMILDKLGIPTWATALRKAFEAQYLEVAKSVSGAAERAGLGASLPDPVARSIVAAGGRRAGLVDLSAQTKKAMFQALAEGRAEGEGAQQLADRIGSYVQGGPWNSSATRAQIIARTETKYAQNVSTIERARAGGVDRFVVFDGRLGPGRSDLYCMARNNSVVTGDQATAMADSEHPNGTLSFAPYFEE
jgi:HK97 family phage portal protein